MRCVNDFLAKHTEKTTIFLYFHLNANDDEHREANKTKITVVRRCRSILFPSTSTTNTISTKITEEWRRRHREWLPTATVVMFVSRLIRHRDVNISNEFSWLRLSGSIHNVNAICYWKQLSIWWMNFLGCVWMETFTMQTHFVTKFCSIFFTIFMDSLTCKIVCAAFACFGLVKFSFLLSHLNARFDFIFLESLEIISNDHKTIFRPNWIFSFAPSKRVNRKCISSIYFLFFSFHLSKFGFDSVNRMRSK